jgi:hypothetical protein
MYEQFLSSVTLLSSLSSEEKSKIADALVSRVLADGEAVVRQGEMGDTFFFVEEGEAIVTQTQSAEDEQLREITVGHLTKGDYFGGNELSSPSRLHVAKHLSHQNFHCFVSHLGLRQSAQSFVVIRRSRNLRSRHWTLRRSPDSLVRFVRSWSAKPESHMVLDTRPGKQPFPDSLPETFR